MFEGIRWEVQKGGGKKAGGRSHGLDDSSIGTEVRIGEGVAL